MSLKSAQISSSWAEAFHDLVEMYEKIGESLPQLLQTERLFRDDTAMRRVLALVYKDILEFHRLAMRYFKQPSTYKPLPGLLDD